MRPARAEEDPLEGTSLILQSPYRTRGCAHCTQVHNEDVYPEGPLAAHPSSEGAFESTVLPPHPNVAEEVEREAPMKDMQQW